MGEFSTPAQQWPGHNQFLKPEVPSKSIQHLPSIQACLSAVQTTRAGTSGCASTRCLCLQVTLSGSCQA